MTGPRRRDSRSEAGLARLTLLLLAEPRVARRLRDVAPALRVEAYLRRQDALWETWRARAAVSPSPVVERLQARRGTPPEPEAPAAS